MSTLLILLRVVGVIACMPLLISAVQRLMACMFGPSRSVPENPFEADMEEGAKQGAAAATPGLSLWRRMERGLTS